MGVGRLLGKVRLWFDTAEAPASSVQRVDWVRVLPFVVMHAACLGVIWVGWSWTAVTVAFALYVVRMFAVTGFYHRYFSHRTFHTSRPAQFVFAVLGNTAVQRGPLWWAAHHRHHHRHADTEQDVHSPRQHGFWWSHMGWITSDGNFRTDFSQVTDLAQFPELRFLDRFDALVPLVLAVALFPARRLAAPDLGILHQYGRPVPLYLPHQLPRPHARPPALRHTGRQPQQPDSGPHYAGGRVAQQPSSVSRCGAAGVPLVGGGLHVLRTPGARAGPPHPRPPPRAPPAAAIDLTPHLATPA